MSNVLLWIVSSIKLLQHWWKVFYIHLPAINPPRIWLWTCQWWFGVSCIIIIYHTFNEFSLIHLSKWIHQQRHELYVLNLFLKYQKLEIISHNLRCYKIIGFFFLPWEKIILCRANIPMHFLSILTIVVHQLSVDVILLCQLYCETYLPRTLSTALLLLKHLSS